MNFHLFLWNLYKFIYFLMIYWNFPLFLWYN